MINIKSFTKRLICSDVKSKEAISMDIVDSVSSIDRKDWNKLADATTIYLSIPYLNSIEKGMGDKIGYRYITYYIKDKPVGIAIFQMKSIDNQFLNTAGVLSSSKSISKKIIEKIDLNMLVSGSIFNSGVPSYYFDNNEISNDESAEAITAGIDAILISDRCKTSINVLLLKEFYAKKIKNENKFKDYSFAEFCLEPNMILTIQPNWNTYESYLQDMTAKYRNKSTTTYKKSSSILIKEFSSKEINEHISVINGLFNQVYERANFSLDKLELKAFETLKNELQEKFIFKTYWLEDKMIAFSTATLDQTELCANYIGIDYEYVKSHAIYQRILYDYVRTTIDYKKNTLNLGRTAGEIKSTIGAKASESICYIRMKNSVSNHFLKPIMNSIENAPFSERNPFKK